MLSQLTVKKIGLVIGLPLLVYGLLQYMRYPIVLQAQSISSSFVGEWRPTQTSETTASSSTESPSTGSSDSTTIPPEKDVDTNTLTFSEATKLRMRLTLGRNLYEYTDDRTIKPFVKALATYRVAPEYNVGTCTVTKVLTTVLANVVCYLFDTDAFLERNCTITEPFFSGKYQFNRSCQEGFDAFDHTNFSPCTRRNSFFSIEELRSNISEAVDILFVARDPTERFLSGFVDKCVNEVRPGLCFDCNGDMDCFLIKFRALMRVIQRDKNFADYFQPKAEYYYELQHFVPQTWFCEMRQNFEEYHFIEYGGSGEEQKRMRDEIGSFLRRHPVPEEKVRYIMDGMEDNKRTKHATVHSPARDDYKKQLFESPILYSMLENLYKPDYELFGFEKPSETRRRQIENNLDR